MALVCNCADLMPPLLRMHPDIRPDDGVLDVVALRADGAWQSVTALMELLVRRGSARDQVWFARGRSIKIEVEGAPLPAQLDGDVFGTTPLDIRVLPGALTVFVDPRTAPGVSGG
jgi:diacylglycerol kinase family enzyme